MTQPVLPGYLCDQHSKASLLTRSLPLLPALPTEQQTEAEQLSEWERIYGAHTPGASGSLSKHTYEFSANNPFLGDPEALAKGRSLFKVGRSCLPASSSWPA